MYFESTEELHLSDDRIIRIWRNETDVKEEYANVDILNTVFEHCLSSNAAIYDTFSKLPNINAVQIMDKETRSGSVVCFVEF